MNESYADKRFMFVQEFFMSSNRGIETLSRFTDDKGFTSDPH